MKNLLYKIVVFFAIFSFGSAALSQNKLDYWLKDVVRKYQEEPAKFLQKTHPGLTVETSTGRPFANVILRAENSDFSFIENYGGILRTIAGPYATALLPLKSISEISTLSKVVYISGAVRLHPLNDLAKKAIGSDVAIAAGYTGEEVLIGVIDSGIDIQHPGFKNSSGTRVRYLWDQTVTETGKSPSYPAYDYGIEWTKTQIDQGICTSKDTDGHGTHVTGSLAQCIKIPSDSAYGGSAIAANLIIVKSNFYGYGIIDGINYIFEKARQLNKPAVINISLGSQKGPHDGLDPFTAAMDYLTGPGRIIVQSAGNDGHNPIHHMVTADGNSEDMDFSIENTAKALEFQLWYDGNKNVAIQIIAPGNVVFPEIVSGAPTTVVNSPKGKVTIDNASDGPEYYNDDKCINLSIDNATAGQWKLRLRSSDPATVHAWMWNGDPEAKFKFSNNDNHYTLVNEACARTNIVVGATVTRNRFRIRDYPQYSDGTELVTGEIVDQLASFTAGGPTRDGREKPDIVAPGTMIASAESDDIGPGTGALFTEFRSIGPRYPAFGLQYQSFMQGTSMSAPVAGGAIAQMLTQKPKSNHSIIKSYLKRFSRSTGSIPPGTSHYRAGNGLINMQALVDNEIQATAVTQTKGNLIILSFNKPANGADNPANYSIIGPSSTRKVINALVTANTVTLTLDGNLIEGENDLLRIQNVSAIAGLEAFATPIEIEIDKIGTIVAPHQVLTNEIWHPDESPYYIHGSVLIPSFVRLTIEPGTIVKFMPNPGDSSQLEVLGQLIAEGTKAKPIVFTSLKESKHGEWLGIRFHTDIPSTILKFCEIRYADCGITCYSNNLKLEDCTIMHSLNIGILVRNCSSTIRRTIIWDSRGGQYADGIQLANSSSTTLIENATIHGNGRIGIACFASNPRIVNCIVSKNDNIGIYTRDGLPPVVTYSDVWGNGRDYDNFSPGIGTISSDPQFVSSTTGNFYLLPNSPCIDKGDPNSGKDPDGSVKDMGALFYDAKQLSNVTNFMPLAGNESVELTWTDPIDERFAGVMILRSIGASVSGKPQYGASYNENDLVGNARVIYKIFNKTTPGFFADSGLINETKYYYKIFSASLIPSYSYGVEVYATPTTIEEKWTTNIPTSYALRQNFPNPFNPSTTIAFDLPKAAEVELNVYDIRGQLVRTLSHGWRPAGSYRIDWDGSQNLGQYVASGVYIIRLQTGSFTKAIKAIMVK